MLDLNYEIAKRKKQREAEEYITIPTQVRICYSGAFLSRLEAERFREEFLAGYEKDINEGYLVLVEDDIKEINLHHVVRILAENSQKGLDFDS